VRLRRNPITPIAGEIAAAMFNAIENLARLTAFLGEIGLRRPHGCAPWCFRWTAFIHHIEHTDLRAEPFAIDIVACWHCARLESC
jgi:hypothetical protein